MASGPIIDGHWQVDWKFVVITWYGHSRST
jgi:hypothetical protein